ncbi:MAG: transcription elongation factor GreA [Bacilli bacterium]|nr:transcription elongation factor GreA [Bacilli bacterium]MDD4643431.1 transcription elongation factor GreA [Bacilli bacterium]
MINEKSKEIYLTKEGLDKVREELKILKSQDRPEIIRAIKEARALGDLSENADYHAAREEQAVLEARIQDLESLVENAIIITNSQFSKVEIGATVTIKYIDDEETEEYMIVGSKEADPSENRISNESPIATAITGHKKGDVVTVNSPNGKYDIEIVDIK